MRIHRLLTSIVAAIAVLVLCPITSRAADEPIAPIPIDPVASETEPITADQLTKAIGGLTLVTVDFTNAPLSDVLASLSRQAGVPVLPSNSGDSDPRGKKLITIHDIGVPFWQAASDVADLSGAGFVEYDNDHSYRLMVTYDSLRNGVQPCIYGPFRVVATSGWRHSTTTIQYNQNGAEPAVMDGFSRLGIMIYADPKLRVLPDKFDDLIETATDESGRSLLSGWQHNGGSAMGLHVIHDNFRLIPVLGAKKIAAIRGWLLATVITSTQSLAVPDALNAINMTRSFTTPAGAETFTVTSVKQDGAGYKVSVKCTGPDFGVGPFEYIEAIFGGMTLSDSSGNQLRRGEATLRPNADGYATFFPANHNVAPGPFALSWTFPTAIAKVKVPFEFHDLLLP